MASAVKRTRREREESCFSRAARAIRRALSRICGHTFSPRLRNACHQSYYPPFNPHYRSGTCDEHLHLTSTDYEMVPQRDKHPPQDVTHSGLVHTPPPSQQPSFTQEPQKKVLTDQSSGGTRKCENCVPSTSCSPDYIVCEPLAMIENSTSSAADVRGRGMNRATAGGLSSIAISAAGYHRGEQTQVVRGSRSNRRASSHPYLHPPNRKDTACGFSRFKSVSVRRHSRSQSVTPTVAGLLCVQGRPTVLQDSTVCTGGIVAQDASELFSAGSESEPEGDGDVLMEIDSPVTAVNYSVTNALPERGHPQPPWSRGDSSRLSRSHSMPSLSQITSAEIRTLKRAESSPDALLKSSSEEFTPDVTADENDDETFRFRCSCPGLYRCSVTGLVFHMGGEGDVFYRTVPWDWRLLVQHHKKPAGPLFDIKCEQQSVRGLHLPHCEIRSTGGCDLLSVAHVKDEGVEFISPNKTTETHVIISVTGFSAFGNVKDGDSPPDPVRALVLLFYRPQADPDPESLLNVLLLPRNVVLRDVLRIRKKTVGDEIYIETSPHCKLHPKQEYTLSASPEDHQVLVQPTEAEFDSDNYDNYFPSFQVTWETTLKHIKLFLRDSDSSHTAWERRVCLSAAGVRRSCGPSALNLPARERLLDVRSGFVEGISGPVLKSLLDKLFEKTVITDSERESADEMRNKGDKARFVVDTVRRKGEAASSEMIEILCEADPFLCEHLGLI
ncbi:hypothetical protein VZT92_014018 [Zoarces viviparus]|uniref:Caspase recruitment domain-containing protein 8 n=1 Tax=Zoarces viviparus TaxID=48416 RepID=A0AAW1EYE2_ZOAVI